MDAKLRATIKSLLGDIEAMRCECPSDIKGVGDAQEEEHWFGKFSAGHFEYEDTEMFSIQWPNLGILAEQLQELLQGHEKVVIGRPLDQ
jgi:hypothetical protein